MFDEIEPAHQRNNIERIPVIGWLGRRALRLISSRAHVEKLIDEYDASLARQQDNMFELTAAVPDSMRDYQTRVIALTLAQRTIQHIRLGTSDAGVWVGQLHEIMATLPNNPIEELEELQQLGLPFDHAEDLRGLFKELEAEQDLG